jgi:hypothetical protein
MIVVGKFIWSLAKKLPLFYIGHTTFVALLLRSHKGTLRNALDFCAKSAKIKRIPKAPFLQPDSKAANVACPT